MIIREQWKGDYGHRNPNGRDESMKDMAGYRGRYELKKKPLPREVIHAALQSWGRPHGR